MIIARPKLSARPEARNAMARASATAAPLTLKDIKTAEMRLESRMPMPVKASQKPKVLSATRPTSLGTISPVSPRPTTMVSTSIPMTSSNTAAPRMVTPSGVVSLLRSPRTRTVMPMDVAVMTAPMNSALTSVMLSAKPNATVRPAPKAKGTTTPPRATRLAGRA